MGTTFEVNGKQVTGSVIRADAVEGLSEVNVEVTLGG